jgi:plasmid stabilization system protein ParE
MQNFPSVFVLQKPRSDCLARTKLPRFAAVHHAPGSAIKGGRIEPSRAALADFDAIYDYVARDNPRAAAEVLRALDQSIQLLASQPNLGRVFCHRRLHLRLPTHGQRLPV